MPRFVTTTNQHIPNNGPIVFIACSLHQNKSIVALNASHEFSSKGPFYCQSEIAACFDNHTRFFLWYIWFVITHPLFILNFNGGKPSLTLEHGNQLHPIVLCRRNYYPCPRYWFGYCLMATVVPEIQFTIVTYFAAGQTFADKLLLGISICATTKVFQ